MDWSDVAKVGLPLAGAAIGSIVAPGAGTVVGGGLGGLAAGALTGGENGQGMVESLLGDPYAGERLAAMKHSQDFLDTQRVQGAANRGHASDAMQQFFGANLNPQMAHMFGGNFGGNSMLMDPAYAHQNPYQQLPGGGGGGGGGGHGDGQVASTPTNPYSNQNNWFSDMVTQKQAEGVRNAEEMRKAGAAGQPVPRDKDGRALRPGLGAAAGAGRGGAY